MRSSQAADAGEAPKQSRRNPGVDLVGEGRPLLIEAHDYLYECEHNARRERAQAGIDDHGAVAAETRARLERLLKGAQEKVICYDFEHQQWWLTYLRKKGIGKLRPSISNLQAMARVGVEVYRNILESDKCVGVPAPLLSDERAAKKKKSVTKFSAVARSYIDANARLTDDIKLDLESVVRDLIEVVGDKPINEYTREDGKKVREALMALPPNRHKRKETRGLSIAKTIAKAKELDLPQQAAKTLRKKRSHLSSIFEYAASDYDNVFNPFVASEAWRTATSAPADQKEPFAPDQLKTLLDSLEPDHRLYWLTWLGLCTGARLNELCQLRTDLIRLEPLPHIYFSPELRLKVKRSTPLPKRSPIRSIPIHPKLIELGLLDLAEKADGLLFPDLKARKLTGRFSADPSKWFAEHLVAIGLGGTGLSYHSLRHNWKAEWDRHHGGYVEDRERLIGHAVAGVAGRYGNGYVGEAADPVLLERRAKLVPALQFPGA